MLELSFRVHHMPEEAGTILEAAKKGVRWLHALGEDNLSARRAWSMCDGMLRGAANRIGQEIDDLPQIPPGHDAQHDVGMGGVSSAPFTGSFSGQQMFQTSGPQGQQFPNYDLNQLMHFDQFPMDPTLGGFGGGGGMGGQGMGGFGAGGPMTDAELEFMSNAYHQGQGHDQSGHQRETRN